MSRENKIGLLIKKFFKALVLSFVIAVPVSLFTIQRYLENYVNKTPISWWIFAIALVVTACISLLTLIRKAANQNPAESIKIE